MLKNKTRWQLFFQNIQQDLKLFLILLAIFSLFRIGFLTVLHQYINEQTTLREIAEALFYGLRLSLKSAGIVTLFSFLCCSLPAALLRKDFFLLRMFVGSTYILALSLLFNARIPFYQEFHIVFNQFIFNTFRDDTVALFYTLVQQYHLVARCLLALLMTVFLSALYYYLLKTRTLTLPRFQHTYSNILFRAGVILFIMVFTVYIRFGGSFSYANSIHWENSALSRDEFLNEAILDDVQALYRAYCNYERLQEATGLNVEAEHIKEYAQLLAEKNMDSPNLDDYLKREALGAKMEKPRHIFVIVGESYSGWPIFPRHEKLNVANGLKSIINRENAIYLPAFLPNGTGTIEAVNGIISGLAEVNLFPNYQPSSYQEAYSTAFAPQMKRLGYKATFWYGGFSSWQRTKAFALAQGFDEYYGANEMQLPFSNAWGTDDRIFLGGIAERITQEQPGFHVILTTSNHPPYTVDLPKEGFDGAQLARALPAELQEDTDFIQRMGHYWYADKAILEFIETVQKKYPDSLFIVTGDHDCRYYTEANPSLFEQKAIPLVIYGRGVNRQLISPAIPGGHLNIMPTLIELIAPKGFSYYSLVPSLTRNNKVGINRDYWISSEAIGRVGGDTGETLPGAEGRPSANIAELQKTLQAAQAVSWWRIHNGKNL